MKSNQSVSYQLLFKEIKNGSKQAFERLYDTLWGKMYRKAYGILRDKDQAKDIVQEVWIDFWNRRHSIENNNIEAYLLNAIRFKVYNTFRNAKDKEILIETFLDHHNIATNPTDEVINLNDTQQVIEATVNQLPKKCKQVFELSRFEGLKNSEIAEKLDISQRTVETHISNAIKVLKTKVSFSILVVILFFC